MPKLVSVIIPCHNMQRWLGEAIDSCLNQTYSPIETVIIDDGSTDQSLDIIKQYQEKYPDQIVWKSGANRGGCFARNLGFSLSKGDYIQFLDADDYLFPDKLAKQVRCMEETGADVVYGDWQEKRHYPDGAVEFGEVRACGPKADFLESLLSNDRWLIPATLLFKRSAVLNSEPWDETLKAAQDRDYLISVARSGANFVYQPGCTAIYRKYGSITVSTRCKRLWFDSHCRAMEKAEQKLAQEGLLTPNYCQALAHAYFEMGKEFLYSDLPHLDDYKFQRYLQAIDKVLSLSPRYQSRDRNWRYNIIQQIAGCRLAEQISYFIAKTKLSFRSVKPPVQAEKTV